MRIKTKKFVMPRSTYMKIMFKTIVHRSIVGSVLLIIIAFLISPYSWATSFFITGIAIILPIRYYHNLLDMSKPEKNHLVYQRRYVTLDDNYITVFSEDGTTHKINLRNVSKLEVMQQSILVHISRMQCLYIGANAFKSQEDLERFKSFLTHVVEKNNNSPATIGKSG